MMVISCTWLTTEYRNLTPVVAIGSKESKNGQLSGPVGVTVHNGSLRVYVTEVVNKRVSVFKILNGQLPLLSHLTSHMM